ncbi:unnamed protein product [Cochlearia groenlandica]
MRPRECDEEEIGQENQEEDYSHQVNLNNNILQQQNQPSSLSSSSSSSRQWSSSSSAFRNPRIVRVSRTFGGKDRHSKVCTVRGLRDRRIRLSVPTAIQLYDLQDRLGLSQPSKVIDWLLDEAKDDVDKLPPLQFPHGFINQMYPNLIFGESSTFQGGGTNLGFLENWDLGGSRTRSSRIVDTQRENLDLDKGKWIKNQEQGFLNTTSQHFSMTNPYNNNNNNTSCSYYNLGHLQHSLDQSGNNVTVALSNNNNNNNNNLNMPPPPPTSSSSRDGSRHMFFGPTPPATMTSLFPTYPNSFLGGGNLQLFNSNNANTSSSSSQQQVMEGNSSLIRPFHHLMNDHDMDRRHSSDNDSDS